MSQPTNPCQEQGQKQGQEREYSISVVGKHVHVTKSIQEYIESRLHKLERFAEQVVHIHVRVEVQKRDHIIDVILHFAHLKVKVRAITEDMYASVDKALERLRSKLRKWKGRIHDYHSRKRMPHREMGVKILEATQEEEEDQEEEERPAPIETSFFPQVVKEKARPLKICTVQEAVMKMELSGDRFLIFRSEEEQRLKVIYRRYDQSYGLMSVE